MYLSSRISFLFKIVEWSYTFGQQCISFWIFLTPEGIQPVIPNLELYELFIWLLDMNRFGLQEIE